MTFDEIVASYMKKLNEETVPAQPAAPQPQTQTQGQQPAQTQQPTQPGADLKARKDALKQKLNQKSQDLQKVIGSVDSMDANKLAELEKTVV